MTPLTTHRAIHPPVLYFGTPVSLISTRNEDGSANLAPMSSSWFLGYTAVLGISQAGQTLPNLRREGCCVINLPTADQHPVVERLAPLTGRYPVPGYKQDRYRFEPDKFAAAGVTEVPSEEVCAPRVGECPVHLEAVVESLHQPSDQGFAIVETRVVKVHVADHLIREDTDYVDIERWQPLFYVFRHYFGLGPDLGRNFRADY